MPEEDLVARALASLRNRDFVAARNCIAAYSNDNPLEFQHYLIRGLSELALKDWGAAAATFEEAIDFFPHQSQLWFNLGVAQENLGLIQDAAESFEHCLDLKPDQGDACGNLSNVYRRMGLFIEAEKMAHRAYEHGAPKAQALNCLGLALARQGKSEAAEKIFRQILGMEPENPYALANLANCAVDRLDFNTAWPLFAAARALNNDPAIRHEEGLARLLAGDTATGWPLCEARLERPGALRVRPMGPMWRGESLVGKRLLLISEQGFGDTLLFCRYGSVLAAHGAILSWRVPKPLMRLFAANLPGDVLPENEPLPETDYWLPMMSLPLATKRPSLLDAPHAPYLRAPAEPKLPGFAKAGRKIGVVWPVSPTNERGYERSMPIEALTPLWDLPNAQFYAPFINPHLDDITNQPVKRLDNLISDFADTAALINQLDYLVTVDTATAHIAGALGIRTFVLVPYGSDWKWGLTGEVSPLYPSITIIRQMRPGDWDSAVVSLIGKLKD